MMAKDGAADSPRWSEGLQKRGTYYEGYVDDLESVLEAHRRDTITSWGTRRSSKAQILDSENKENLVQTSGDPVQRHVRGKLISFHYLASYVNAILAL